MTSLVPSAFSVDASLHPVSWEGHPREMGAGEITQFLTDLAVQRKVAASTPMQAMNALVFVYTHALGRQPGEFSGLVRAHRPRKVRTT